MRDLFFIRSSAISTQLFALLCGMLWVDSAVSFADEKESAGPKGKQVATVLGKPIYEGDINKHLTAKDNVIRLIIDPLTQHYCQEHGIDRDEELKARIPDEGLRAGAKTFVLRSELQRHLYETHGGRVILSAFGPVAFDGTKKWIEEHQKAGDLQIADPKLRQDLRQYLDVDIETTRFASPSQIRAAFDPANTERFIDNMAKATERGAVPGKPASPVMVTIGEVAGQSVQVDQQQLLNEENVSTVLRDAFVVPLEKVFLGQHPEIGPSEKEIAALCVGITSNGEEAIKSMKRSLDQIDAQLKQAKPGTDEHGDLQWSKDLVEKNLSNAVDEGRRVKALLIARPAKLQQYLLDQYDGGRALRRGAMIFAFDAQLKWVRELEQQGHFKITDPKLRAKFYDYWNNETPHQGSLTTNPRTVHAWFNPPWTEPSVVANKTALDGAEK
ncbi:MAG: hypothetical protein WBD20_16835 [Pirellulaceae bacterium]